MHVGWKTGTGGCGRSNAFKTVQAGEGRNEAQQTKQIRSTNTLAGDWLGINTRQTRVVGHPSLGDASEGLQQHDWRIFHQVMILPAISKISTSFFQSLHLQLTCTTSPTCAVQFSVNIAPTFSHTFTSPQCEAAIVTISWAAIGLYHMSLLLRTFLGLAPGLEWGQQLIARSNLILRDL